MEGVERELQRLGDSASGLATQLSRSTRAARSWCLARDKVFEFCIGVVQLENAKLLGVVEDPKTAKKQPKKSRLKEVSRPLETLRRLIADMYEAKVVADRAWDKSGMARQDLRTFVADFLKQRYGLQKIATQKLRALRTTVKRFSSQCVRVHLFSHLAGFGADGEHVKDYDPHAADFFLTFIGTMWPNSISSKLTTGAPMAADVFRATATRVVGRGVRESPKWKDLVEKLRLDRAVEKGDPGIDADVAMSALLELWPAERRQREQEHPDGIAASFLGEIVLPRGSVRPASNSSSKVNAILKGRPKGL